MIQGKSLIIWDWNGTLLDDTGVCIASMNQMLARRGMASAQQDPLQAIVPFSRSGILC